MVLRVPRFRITESVSYHGRHDSVKGNRRAAQEELSQCELSTYDFLARNIRLVSSSQFRITEGVGGVI
jgi:hypothetical protein